MDKIDTLTADTFAEISVDPAEETSRILRDTEALIENDHFVYVSGDHGSGWIDKDVIFTNTETVDKLSKMLADATVDLDIDVVCGPSFGGVVVATWTARHLAVLSVYAEQETPAEAEQSKQPLSATTDRPRYVLKRNYDKIVHGKRVLVADDIVNAGISIRSTADAVKAAGGEVVAAATYVNRGNVTAADIGVPEFRYLLEYPIPHWPANNCKLCKSGTPINTDHAHGSEFLERVG